LGRIDIDAVGVQNRNPLGPRGKYVESLAIRSPNY
jgi:hypothetical protein